VLKSAELLKISQAIRDDPFAKVKKLIQELIERLLAEAAEEASHKGWCDKEMALAKQLRDTKADSVKELNGALAKNEARRDKLTEQIEKLKIEKEDLEFTLADNTEMRAEEKEENAETIKDSKEAAEAVTEAIDVLKKFYASAKNAQSLVQVRASSSALEIPDAGFGDKYEVAQGGPESVIGMLEVVRDDFVKQGENAKKAEEQAEADFKEFETTSKASSAEKEVVLKAKEDALNETTTAIQNEKEKLEGDSAAMNKALEELISLHSACVDDGESAEEKKANREAEIDALQQALCILNKKDGVTSFDC